MERNIWSTRVVSEDPTHKIKDYFIWVSCGLSIGTINLDFTIPRVVTCAPKSYYYTWLVKIALGVSLRRNIVYLIWAKYHEHNWFILVKIVMLTLQI